MAEVGASKLRIWKFLKQNKRNYLLLRSEIYNFIKKMFKMKLKELYLQLDGLSMLELINITLVVISFRFSEL